MLTDRYMEDEMADTPTVELNDDIDDGWTVQQGPRGPEARHPSLDPVRYLPEQLPDPEAAEKAKTNPQQLAAHQTIYSEDDVLSHPNGPEPEEAAVIMGKRAGLDPGVLLQEEEEEEEVEEAGKSLDSMTKAELQDYADAQGIDGVDMDGQTKAEMIETVEAAEG